MSTCEPHKLPTVETPLPSGLLPGAPDAVDALLDRHLENVYGLAMAILKNKHEAEEAVREVFLTVVRNAARFQGNLAFPSRIYRICVNACLMRQRMGRRTKPVPIEEFLPVFTQEDTHAGPVEDWHGEAEHRNQDQEIDRVIGRFSEELPEKYHLVFVLCDIQGFSFEETAQVLGVTIATAKSRLHRARLCMRERLSRYLLDKRGSLDDSAIGA